MKIALIVLATAIIIAAALFIIGPAAGIWFPAPQVEEAQDQVTEGLVTLEQPGPLVIRQGHSEPEALVVTNDTDRFVHFTLSHAKTHLTLEPGTDLVGPGASRAIAVHIDDLFPPGGTEMMIYMLAEAEGLSFNIETYYVSLEVIPGELELQTENGRLQAYWQGEPAPPGVTVSYRDPEADGTAWRTWGVTPDLAPPTHLRPGYHVLEFIALYGMVESSQEMLEIYIPEEEAAEERTSRTADPEPQETGEAAEAVAAGEAEEEEPAPTSIPPPDPHMDHIVTFEGEEDEDSPYEPPQVQMPRQPGQGSRQWWEP